MVRWWWFGTAVTKPEIQRELEVMKAGGFGGVESSRLIRFSWTANCRG